MFGGMANKIGILAKKGGGGGSDVTPDAIDWSDISYFSLTDNMTYITTKQLTGIGTNITLEISTDSTTPGFLFYVNDSVEHFTEGSELDVGTAYYNADVLGIGFYYTNFDNTNPITITGQNNYYITFGCAPYAEGTFTITVKNVSDGNAVLDTFTVTQF